MHHLNPGDPMVIRNYTQQYQYDVVGNILEMKHQVAGNNWTRDYNYQVANNRLISTQVGVNTYNYPHHPQHGFMTAMPHLEDMGWNFKEELVKTIRQRRTDGGTPETTWYQYDGQGQRIRKITENTANAGVIPSKKEERIYIAGYELYKKHSGTYAGLQRISLSLMDEGHRFVMVETRNDVDDGTKKYLVRYQLHNHLGSASLELDGTSDAKVISYEEYHPYGTTAYQSKNAAIKSVAKRYRYTGKERDDETGLYYYGARYYAAWLGRWVSCDPIGIKDSLNIFQFVKGNPIKYFDDSGYESEDKVIQENLIEIAPRIGFELSIAGIKPGETSKGESQLKSNLSQKSTVSSREGLTVSDIRARILKEYDQRILRDYILKGKPPPKQKTLRTFKPKTKEKIEPFSFEDFEMSIKGLGIVVGMSYEATDYLFPWWTQLAAGGVYAGKKYFLKPIETIAMPRPPRGRGISPLGRYVLRPGLETRLNPVSAGRFDTYFI